MNRRHSRHRDVTRLVGGVGTFLATLFIACAPQVETTAVPEVVIGGLDYTFDVSSGIPSGPVDIVFENRGQVRHEVVLVELKPGADLAAMAEVAQSGGDPFSLVQQFGGVLIAEAGEHSWGRLRVELTSGTTYGLICNFQDAEGEPPHTALGMMRTFRAE